MTTLQPYQQRVLDWLLQCFGEEIAADKTERGDRFIEEALELLQSVDYPVYRIFALIKYVYGRPKGEMVQEAGGVMVTLASFCAMHDIDMHTAGETELTRVWTNIEAIRAKQAAKPTGSALPVAGAGFEPVKRFDLATVHPAGQQPRGQMIEHVDGEFMRSDDLAEIASHFFCIGHEDGVMQTKAAYAQSVTSAEPTLIQHRVRHKVSDLAGWSDWSGWREGSAATEHPDEIEIETRSLFTAPTAISPVVTPEDAISFLKGAVRNWSHVPRLSEDNVSDVATELLRFLLKRLPDVAASSNEGNPLLDWAIEQWRKQVQHRPLRNVHRRTLDDVWRQVIRWTGANPETLIGPTHDELLAAAPALSEGGAA